MRCTRVVTPLQVLTRFHELFCLREDSDRLSVRENTANKVLFPMYPLFSSDSLESNSCHPARGRFCVISTSHVQHFVICRGSQYVDRAIDALLSSLKHSGGRPFAHIAIRIRNE